MLPSFCVAAIFAAFSGALSPLIAQQTFRRTYTASAYVNLWSIPVFSRSDVGYGYALEEQHKAGDGEVVELDFCSGSIPERSHGLNRFGYIHELVTEKNQVPVAADYLGAMTMGGNQAVHGGQAVFDTHTGAEVPYLTASQHIANHQAHATLRRLSLPVPREPTMQDVIRRIRESWETPGSGTAQQERSLPAHTARTFLYNIRSAILSDSSVLHQDFIYVGKRYRLNTEKSSDAAIGAQLQRLNLTRHATQIMRLKGLIENLQTREHTEFNLWYEDGSTTSLPLRFEFRPKSYLRLVFDAQPGPDVVPSHSSASIAGKTAPELK